MLVSLREILAVAENNGTAVGAFDTPNLESLLAALEAAESLKLPVIVQFAQCHEDMTPLSVVGPSMVQLAKRASVPVCVHLDHGETLEYLECALRLGFTGIMYDGSALPYAENAANTRAAVALASEYGAGVEAELGSMGRRETGAGETETDDPLKIYTDPAEAARFIRETGVDALACSFGTTHGVYLSRPKLDFSIVERVRAKTGGAPVVMHGGSGISAQDYRRALRAGVRKVNYFTYMDRAGGLGAAEYLRRTPPGQPVFFTALAAAAQTAMREDIARAMRIFGGLDAAREDGA